MRLNEEFESIIKKQIRLSSITSFVSLVAAVSCLIPVISQNGIKYPKIQFCFAPKDAEGYVLDGFCENGQIYSGVAWRVAQELENSPEFRSKTSVSPVQKGKGTYKGYIGMFGGFLLLAATATSKMITGNMKSHLFHFMLKKHRELVENELKHHAEVELTAHKVVLSKQFEADTHRRDFNQAMANNMTIGEIERNEEESKKNKELMEELHRLKLMEIQAETSRLEEDKTKHQKNIKKNTNRKNQEEDEDDINIETLMKEHEKGWIYDLVIGRKPILIYGSQGAYKSYTAACLAMLKMSFQKGELYKITDPHLNQNRDKAWKELLTFKPGEYASNDSWSEYDESIKDSFEFWAERNQKSQPSISIWDELTMMGKCCPDFGPKLMPKICSAPRKANSNEILITHNRTKEGLGGFETGIEMLNDAVISIKLKSNNRQEPLFKGILSGYIDEEGEQNNDLLITLPDWFRTEIIYRELFQKEKKKDAVK